MVGASRIRVRVRVRVSVSVKIRVMFRFIYDGNPTCSHSLAVYKEYQNNWWLSYTNGSSATSV